MTSDDQTEEIWNLVGFVKGSGQRKSVFEILSKEALTPKEIAEKAEMHQSNVSRALRQLKEKELVKVMNPEAKVGRVYVLTERGKETYEKMNEKC